MAAAAASDMIRSIGESASEAAMDSAPVSAMVTIQALVAMVTVPVAMVTGVAAMEI